MSEPGSRPRHGFPAREAILALTVVASLGSPSSDLRGQDRDRDRIGDDTYRILPASRLEVRTGTSGFLGGLAHAHTIRARDFSGTLRYVPGRLGDASVRVRVPARELEVRTRADEGDRRSIRDAMLTEVLDAERHPAVTFVSTDVSPRGPDSVRVRGELTLAGRARSVTTTLAFEAADRRIWAWGSFSILQSDFGIEPYSLAMGTVSVSDRVTFYLDVIAERERSDDPDRDPDRRSPDAPGRSATGPGHDRVDAPCGELHLPPVPER